MTRAGNSSKLRKAVTAKNIQKHLTAFQNIANDNGGNRAAGTNGHVDSAEYVEAKLHKAGYETTRQAFSYDKTNLDESNFEQVAPTADRVRPAGAVLSHGLLR